MRNVLTVSAALVVGLFVSAYLSSCSKPPAVAAREEAEKLWGSERVCLPCHIYQRPIARQHNYRCDSCHLGNPWAEDLQEGHFEMIRNPQTPEQLTKTCDKCHRRVLGRDVPYDAQFIRDVLVSHKMKKGETLEWHD